MITFLKGRFHSLIWEREREYLKWYTKKYNQHNYLKWNQRDRQNKRLLGSKSEIIFVLQTTFSGLFDLTLSKLYCNTRKCIETVFANGWFRKVQNNNR